jgi:Tfp pilus assembly protein PilV
MSVGRLCAHEGSSLLEVLVALVLVALAMVGALACQLQAVTVERFTAERERALVIAASVAESMRDEHSGSNALSRWQAYAAAVLPGAEISIVDRLPGVALVAVRWAAQNPPSKTSFFTREGCMAEPVTAGRACAAVPFVR